MIPLGTLGGDHFISRAWLLTLVTRIPVGVPPGTVEEIKLPAYQTAVISVAEYIRILKYRVFML